MSAAVLIIEDEATLAKNVATYLKRNGYDTCVAASGEEGLSKIETFRPEVVLLDYALPGINGIDVLKRIKAVEPNIPVIVVTGQGSELVAVEAMKAGACDYLIKPVVLSELALRLEKLTGLGKLEEELTYYRRKIAEEGHLDQLIGRSQPMIALKDAIGRLIAAEAGLADAELPAVLITGETGTGKEVVARALHYDGPRKNAPFVELNCSTIPGDLLEAELFGYERGAFTDAKQRKLGLIEAAGGGTLFLDEIGDLDVRLQVKLLKLLEDKTLRRLGSVREQRANVRIVAATNRDLEQAVRDGQFRADLLFRLRIVHFELPPLRARGTDITLLARHFLDQQARRYRKGTLAFTLAAEAAMLRYAWPGNVRELRNVLEQAVIMASGLQIDAADLRLTSSLASPMVAPAASATTPQVEASADVRVPNLASAERDLLVRALAQSDGNVSQAARLLGVTRDTLRYRIEKHGLKVTE
jgi:DNA-binding NtrC family response regulator